MLTIVRFASLFLTLVATLATGCGDSRRQDEPTTQITIALMSVPADVFCVEVTVTSSGNTTTRRVDVTPGTSALITVTGLAAGPATVDEKAYGVPCNMVIPGTTQPTWVAVAPVAVTLAAGQTTDVAIVLKRPPQIRISNDFQDSPKLTTSPMVVTFAMPATVGGPALTQTLTVTNSGTVPAPFAASITGSDAAHFVVVHNCPSPGAPLAVGASCLATVAFSPTMAGPKTAYLSLGMPAALLVPVSGTAQVVAVAAAPSTVNFGSVLLASTPAPRVVDVTNTGTVPITFAAGITGMDAALFSISASSCPATGGSLAVGAICTLTVSHTPNALGAKSATLNIGSPTLTTVALASTVTTPITAMPASVNFNNVTVGTTPPNIVVTVNNTAAAPIPFGTSLSGPDAPLFGIVSTNCPAGGMTLMGGASCSVTLRFTPTSVGVKTATLNLGAPTVVATVPLQGIGTSAMLSTMPASLTFPTTLVGTPAPTQVVTVTNSGAASVPFAMAISGAPDFSITTTTCPGGGAPLAPGASCTVTIRFLPATAGTMMASLALGMPVLANVSLSGTGATPALTLSPGALAFGNVQVGAPMGSALVLGINNTGSVSATIAPAISGTDAAMFTITANNCPAALGVGMICAITVRALPASIGAKSANLALGTVSTIPLIANGVTTQTLSVQPTAMAFGSAFQGGPALTQTVRVINTATTPVLVAPAFVGPDAPLFTVASTSCPASLPPGGPCSIVVRFMPALGAKTATLNLTSAPVVASIALTATGVSAAVVTTSPPAGMTVMFPNLPINNTTGVPIPVTITNTSGAALAVPLTLTGADPGQFAILSTSCPTGAATLAAGANCSALVRFAPVSAGNKSANLSIGSPVVGFVTLAGTGM